MNRFIKWIRKNIEIIAVLAIPTAVPIISLIVGIWFSFNHIATFLSKIGFGYWLVGLIVLLLSIICVIQIIRGAVAIFEIDDEVFGLSKKKQDWRASIYAVIVFLSYVSLLVFLAKIM